MDQDIFLVLDFDKSCRLCLQTKGVMSDIFDISEDISLTEQIEKTTGVIISQFENLPMKICHKCRYIVELSFELRETVVRSNDLLKETINHDAIPETENPEKDTAQTSKEPTIPIAIEQNEENEPTYDPIRNNIDMSEICMKAECEETEDSKSSHDFFGVKVEKDRTTCFETDWLAGDEDKTEKCTKNALRTKKKYSVQRNKTKSTPKYLTCLICLEVFECRTAVLQHARSVHYHATELTPYMIATKPFACELCGVSISTRRHLVLHHLSHLDVSPFVCSASGCEFRAKTKEKLRHHSYTHAERKYVCETCGSAFRRKFELAQHAMRHADEGSSFPCRLCRVVCRNRLSFKAHLRYHELGHRFKCQKPGCPKGFYSRNDLQVHERSHNNERLFRCHMCVSSYVSQSQLNRHLRQHDKQRVSKCDKCSATFNNYTQFYNHRVAAHGPWQPHKCFGCIQGYQSIGQLENHTARCRLAQNIKTLEKQGHTNSSAPNNEDSSSNYGFNNINNDPSSNDGIGNSNVGIGNSNDGIGNSNDRNDDNSQSSNENNNLVNLNNNISNSNDNFSNSTGNVDSSNNDIGNSNDGIHNSNESTGNSNDVVVNLELEEFLGPRFRRTVTGPVLVKPSMLKNVKINNQDDELPANSLLYIEVDNEEEADDPGSQSYTFLPN